MLSLKGKREMSMSPGFVLGYCKRRMKRRTTTRRTRRTRKRRRETPQVMAAACDQMCLRDGTDFIQLDQVDAVSVTSAIPPLADNGEQKVLEGEDGEEVEEGDEMYGDERPTAAEDDDDVAAVHREAAIKTEEDLDVEREFEKVRIDHYVCWGWSDRSLSAGLPGVCGDGTGLGGNTQGDCPAGICRQHDAPADHSYSTTSARGRRAMEAGRCHKGLYAATVASGGRDL
jgi:hypothetical protein